MHIFCIIYHKSYLYNFIVNFLLFTLLCKTSCSAFAKPNHKTLLQKFALISNSRKRCSMPRFPLYAISTPRTASPPAHNSCESFYWTHWQNHGISSKYPFFTAKAAPFQGSLSHKLNSASGLPRIALAHRLKANRNGRRHATHADAQRQGQADADCAVNRPFFRQEKVVHDLLQGGSFVRGHGGEALQGLLHERNRAIGKRETGRAHHFLRGVGVPGDDQRDEHLFGSWQSAQRRVLFRGEDEFCSINFNSLILLC